MTRRPRIELARGDLTVSLLKRKFLRHVALLGMDLAQDRTFYLGPNAGVAGAAAPTPSRDEKSAEEKDEDSERALQGRCDDLSKALLETGEHDVALLGHLDDLRIELNVAVSESDEEIPLEEQLAMLASIVHQ